MVFCLFIKKKYDKNLFFLNILCIFESLGSSTYFFTCITARISIENLFIGSPRIGFLGDKVALHVLHFHTL